MTGRKQGDENHHQHPHAQHNHGQNVERREDDIQRAFWHHWKIILIVIAVLAGARLVLPHIPILKGWEQKFSGAAIEIGKTEIPPDALKVGTYEAAVSVFEKPGDVPPDLVKLNGPVLVAAWKCESLGESASCLRYIWKGEPLTLVMTFHMKRFRKPNGPFSRTGWGGYYIVHKNLASALVGPFDPSEILNAWPYAVTFANQPRKE